MNTAQLVSKFRSRAILLNAPTSEQMDLFEKFVRELLVPCGIDTVLLLIRYYFRFDSHPEVIDEPAMTKENAQRIAALCKELNLTLVPKINRFGHNSTGSNGTLDEKKPLGLLKAYPQFEEITGEPIVDTRCLCLRHPDVGTIVCDLIDELMETFATDQIHVGLDEALYLGKCPRCKGIPPETLFGDWVNYLQEHIAARNGTMWMWADRLVDGNLIPCQAAGFETSLNGTWRALPEVSKDIIICSWNYEIEPYGHHAPAYWAKHRFRHYVCPYRNPEATDQLLNAAYAVDSPYLLGVMLTTWCDFGAFANQVWDMLPSYRETHTSDYYRYPESYKAEHRQYVPYQVACNFLKMFIG